MNASNSPASDDALFARLRALWNDRDPMPSGLVDDVLVAIATRDLGIEYALLTRMDGAALVGVRGEPAAQVFEFAGDTRTVMLRASSLADGRRRLDGWIAPAAAAIVRLRLGGPEEADELTTLASAEGRFEFADLPSGPAQLWVEPTAAPEITNTGLTTPEFEI